MPGFFDTLKNLFKDNRIDLTTRYQIVRDAVNGTMSNFHMAVDRETNQSLGLKILDSEKTAQFESRFKGLNKPSEGQIAKQVQHPRVVSTYDFGTAKDGRQFITMEFLEGASLNNLINNRDPILNGNRVTLIRHMAEAIAAVHKAGFIHRDICPRNFIVASDGKSLKLIDFGLAVPIKREYLLPGNRTGTPLYMAPEIVRRRNTDERLDLFAFGVSAYQLCAHDFPWPSTDISGKGALQHDTKPPRPILELCPNLNPVLAKVIMQCIESEPDRRPASADAIVQALRNVPSEKA